MNLYELFVKLGVKDEGLKSGIDKATKIVKGFAKATTVAIGAGVTAFSVLTKNALTAAGELEQNLSGAEAVFDTSANRMVKTAAEAFDKMGLSQSDYLATANKMGALFQGSGFGIEESADMATAAMQRAADVASIMGLDVSAAMEAVAGAAKGNFTMMDNLGVAINDTTLQMYAQEKGLGKLKTTQDKVNAAMQMFLEKTKYAAGNYAKENDTFAGSLTTLRAAWANFMSGAGDATQLVDAAVNAGGVVVENIGKIVPRLAEGLTQAMTQLLPQLPGIIEELLPGVLDGAGELISGIIGILPSLIGTIVPILIEQLPVIFQSIVQAVSENSDAFLEAGKLIIQYIADGLHVDPSIIMSALGGLLGGKLVSMLTKIPGAIGIIKTAVSGLFTLLKANPIGIIITVIGAVIGYLVTLYNTNDEFRAKVDQVVSDVVAWVTNAVNTVKTFFTDTIPNAINAAIDWITSIPGRVVEFAANMYETAAEFLKQFIQGVYDGFLQLVGQVGDWVEENLITPIDNKIENFVETGRQVVEKIKEGISAAWDGLVQWFSGIWDNLFTKHATFSVDSNGASASPKAIGMDYVPYNNYPAMLHRGEAVLTSAEAEDWRNGKKNGGGMTINQYISATPTTPVQLASATAAYFEQARWAI